MASISVLQYLIHLTISEDPCQNGNPQSGPRASPLFWAAIQTQTTLSSSSKFRSQLLWFLASSPIHLVSILPYYGPQRIYQSMNGFGNCCWGWIAVEGLSMIQILRWGLFQLFEILIKELYLGQARVHTMGQEHKWPISHVKGASPTNEIIHAQRWRDGKEA